MLALVAIVAAGCSSQSSPLSLDEYADAMQAVETQFETEAPHPRTEDDSEYPLGGDLIIANQLFAAYEDRLDGWRAITPPSGVAESHDRLVASLDAVQSEVGDYLGEEAMTGEDFDFDSIGSAVRSHLISAGEACRDLRSALREAGFDVEFADNCRF